MGGLACHPSLLRMTLSRAAVSGFGGSAARAPPPRSSSPGASHGGAAASYSGQKVSGREAPRRPLAQSRGARGARPGAGSLEAGQPGGHRLRVRQRRRLFPVCVAGLQAARGSRRHTRRLDLKPTSERLCASVSSRVDPRSSPQQGAVNGWSRNNASEARMN